MFLRVNWIGAVFIGTVIHDHRREIRDVSFVREWRHFVICSTGPNNSKSRTLSKIIWLSVLMTGVRNECGTLRHWHPVSLCLWNLANDQRLFGNTIANMGNSCWPVSPLVILTSNIDIWIENTGMSHIDPARSAWNCQPFLISRWEYPKATRFVLDVFKKVETFDICDTNQSFCSFLRSTVVNFHNVESPNFVLSCLLKSFNSKLFHYNRCVAPRRIVLACDCWQNDVNQIGGGCCGNFTGGERLCCVAWWRVGAAPVPVVTAVFVLLTIEGT
jgi:hypothetical protein